MTAGKHRQEMERDTPFFDFGVVLFSLGRCLFGLFRFYSTES